MKKLIFTLVLGFVSTFTFSAIADGPEPAPIIPPSDGNGPKSRDLTDIPRVWYDFDGGYFIVAIQSMETTTLTVENSSGATVVQTTVNTDGYSHSYPVASLPSGIYLVTLENVEESHSGYLLIP